MRSVYGNDFGLTFLNCETLTLKSINVMSNLLCALPMYVLSTFLEVFG